MSPRKTYILKLYVAGNTPNSMRALKTLRNILETEFRGCLLYTSPSPRDRQKSRMPSSA